MIRVGLLGCGNVAEVLVKQHADVEIIACFDLIRDHADAIAKLCGCSAYDDFDAFLNEPFDIVVEAASVNAVVAYGEKALLSGRDIVILSVGAFADRRLKVRLEEIARQQGKTIYIPSGAIIGLDNLKIGQISRIDKLLLRTTKNPRSLGLEISKRELVFQGRASECIKEFPKNINVAVALELASGHEVEVELWADPDIERNIHEIFVEGEFGDFHIKVRNNPCPENPATSFLAALSIATLLKNIDQPMRIGT